MGLIYNPWHGCTKISEGCEHCYMYFLDKQYEKDSSIVTKSKFGFKLPIQKDRQKNFKVKSGMQVMTCMTSDFFHEDADPWRPEVWEMLKFRSDVIWFIITKRVENIPSRLPPDWENGYENIIIGLTTENQKRADQRIPLFLNIPIKHRQILCAPFLEQVYIENYLKSGLIECVTAGGENYDGARPCHFSWVQSLYNQCYNTGVEFNLYETGTNFVLPDGKIIHEPKRAVQSQNARLMNAYLKPKTPHEYKLFYPGTNQPVTRPQPIFDNPRCAACGNQPTCGGCSHCGKCG